VPSYPIRAVSRLTGISVDTLRAWERRYEAVAPARGQRGRSYSESDVARLQRLGLLVRRGHAIGTIAALSDKALNQLVASSARTPEARTGEPAIELDELNDALNRYDLVSVEAFLSRHAAALLPRDLVFKVVLPALRELGARWQAGTLRPSHEHLVSAIVRSILGGLLRVTTRPHASPQVVFATLPGERHELGLLCAALLAASAGFGVLYLGPELPAGDVAHAANHTGARVAVLSATTARPGDRKEVAPLTALTQEMEVWVGGRDAVRVARAIGPGARVVEDLESLVAMLADRARPVAITVP
jgi:DNA-binding transcriptional MerR regulator